MPNAAPNNTAAANSVQLKVGVMSVKSRPRKSPNQAPLSAPSSAARCQDRLRTTCSTVLRSLPMMESCATGKSAFARRSTTD